MVVGLSGDKQILREFQKLCEFDSRFGYSTGSEVLVLCVEPDTLSRILDEGKRVIGVYSRFYASQASVPTTLDPVLGKVPACLAAVSMLFEIQNESLLKRSNELYIRAKGIIEKPVTYDSFYDRYRGIA